MRDLQRFAAEEHRAIKHLRDQYLAQEEVAGPLMTRAEARAVLFLACWSLRFGESEPEPWA